MLSSANSNAVAGISYLPSRVKADFVTPPVTAASQVDLAVLGSNGNQVQINIPIYGGESLLITSGIGVVMLYLAEI